MEIQEVIETLDHLKEFYCGVSNKEGKADYTSPFRRDAEALKIAIPVLLKQRPMKVIERRFAGFYDCPKCEGDIERMGYQYCPSCGQKLDWRK